MRNRIKKKIEADINELEMALDHANKANAEAVKQVKKILHKSFLFPQNKYSSVNTFKS